MTEKITMRVYMDDGRVYEYDVYGADKAREHAAAICAGGYRHNDGKTFEHYPPHRVLKVSQRLGNAGSMRSTARRPTL